MRKNVEPSVQLNVRIPESLAGRISLRLHDPVAGRVKYGKMAQLIVSLLRQWDEQQTKGAQQTRAEPPAP